MIERKTISYSDQRVIDAVKTTKNVSRFFEEAAIYYLESIKEERINSETIKDIVIDVLKGMIVTQPISNPNYTECISNLDEDIKAIIDID